MTVWSELFDIAFLRDLLVALTGIVLGIWLPAWLGLRRFRTRQWWERKAGHYQEVVSTLGNLKRLEEGTLQDEVGTGPSRDEAHERNMTWEREESHQRLRRQANEGAFLMSPDSLDVLDRYFRDIALSAGRDTPREAMIDRVAVTNDALIDLVAAARRDLGVRA